MDDVTALFTIDYPTIFVAVFTILVGLKAVVSIFEGTIGRLGLETKWMRKKREERELLIQTAKGLAELQKRHEEDTKYSNEKDQEFYRDIKKLTDLFINKEIDDMRWEINNFATKVAEGKPCNKDSFKHCIHIYEKYEKILEENHLENGEVEISMELINEVYKQKLKEGF